MRTTTSLPCVEPGSRNDDVVVWTVLTLVGALGVGIGLLSPERSIELALGLVILLFVGATVVFDRQHRHCPKEPPRDN